MKTKARRTMSIYKTSSNWICTVAHWEKTPSLFLCFSCFICVFFHRILLVLDFISFKVLSFSILVVTVSEMYTHCELVIWLQNFNEISRCYFHVNEILFEMFSLCVQYICE